MSYVVLCVELGCGLKLALVTLLKLHWELEAVYWFLAEAEVGRAETLGQEEQVGQREGVRAQWQWEMTQRCPEQWSVPHCWAHLGEFVPSEPLLLFPSLAVSSLFWLILPGRLWVYARPQKVKLLQRHGQPPLPLVGVPSSGG